jgi:hypothetical protein
LVLAFFIVVFVVFSFNRVKDYITSDFTAPVIHADSDSMQVSVTADESELLVGMTAVDNLDGDVTDTLVVVSKSKFISKGTLRVNYAAFDKNNNVGIAARYLTYTDYHSPRFSMSQPLRYPNGNTNNNYLKYITASDCLDGNITQQIKINFGNTESTGNTSTRQKMYIQVTNSAGDTSSLELWASFEDYNSYSTPAPALTDYIIYTTPGVRPDYNSYIKGVWNGGSVRSFADAKFDQANDVRISDIAVNYNSPGVYTATYQLSREEKDGSGRTAFGSATMIVVVEG